MRKTLVVFLLISLRLHAADKFEVGFRSILAFDQSRPAFASSLAGTGRPMQIAVWYPAQNEGSITAKRMKLGDYIQLMLEETDPGRPNIAKKKRALQDFISNIVEIGGDAEIAASIGEIADFPCHAISGAKPYRGRFPLVVYPSYKMPASISILAEFLAAHGYVVAALSMKGTSGPEPEISVEGFESEITDMLFVIQRIREEAYASKDRLALLGAGFNASACLALALRNREVDAMISLDGGITTESETRMLKQVPYWEPSALRVPLLAIYAPHPSVIPSLLEQYRYADRYLVEFPKMSEYYFSNFGILEASFPGIIGKAPGNTKLGFETASWYILHFLNAFLAGRRDEAGSLSVSSPGLAEAKVLNAAAPAPPLLQDLKSMLLQKKPGELRDFFEVLRMSDPQAYTNDTFADVMSWLGWRRDPDWSLRRVLGELRVASYPESSRAHFSLAQVYQNIKNNELAKREFKSTLTLLGHDCDPMLDDSLKERIRSIATQYLNEP